MRRYTLLLEGGHKVTIVQDKDTDPPQPAPSHNGKDDVVEYEVDGTSTSLWVAPSRIVAVCSNATP
jgi:hypothetical protein